jgi:hypothetical protein
MYSIPPYNSKAYTFGQFFLCPPLDPPPMILQPFITYLKKKQNKKPQHICEFSVEIVNVKVFQYGNVFFSVEF